MTTAPYSTDLPTVRVVIPHCRNTDLLKACLESLAKQSFHDFEIVVVVNGAAVPSVRCSTDLRLRWLVMGGNRGFAAAVNAGISNSRAEFLFILNDDTTLDPSCLGQLVAVASVHPTYAVYAPRILEMATGDLYAAGLMFSRFGYGNRSQRFSLRDRVEPADVFGFCGAAALIRRDALDDVGLFNEAFRFLQEDVELSFRFQLQSRRCLYVPTAVVHHHGSATLRQMGREAVYEAVRNAFIVLLTCVPRQHFVTHGRSIAAFYARFLHATCRQGFRREVALSFWWLLAHAPWIIRRRSRLQRHRTLDEAYLRDLLFHGPVQVNLPQYPVWFQ